MRKVASVDVNSSLNVYCHHLVNREKNYKGITVIEHDIMINTNYLLVFHFTRLHNSSFSQMIQDEIKLALNEWFYMGIYTQTIII